MTRPPPDRDRDDAGRARSARPRDAYGRPLPHGAAGVERVPDNLVLPAEATLVEAQCLLDAGRPFHAHEVLEAAWKSGPERERPLWQGLAQLAVGLTHAQRGNAVGAASLLRRGSDRIEPFTDPAPHGVAAGRLVEQARALADLIESAGLGAVGATDLRLRLSVRSQDG